MFRSTLALAAFYVLCITSTVAQTVDDANVSDAFICTSNALYGLCCKDTIGDDGSVTRCQSGQQVLSLGTSGSVCGDELKSAGYSVAACCAVKDLQAGEVNGAGCVAGMLQTEAARRTDADTKARREAYPNAFKLLGLPVPRSLQKKAPKTTETSGDNTGSGRPPRSEKKFVRRSAESPVEAAAPVDAATEPPSAAARMGLPSRIDAAGATTKDGQAAPVVQRRSRKVDNTAEKLQSRKSPRMAAVNALPFVG